MAIDVTTGLPAPGTALDPWLIELSPARLRSAKYAYTTRYLADLIARQPRGYFLQAAPDTGPRPGDVVLAEVVELGHHRKLESPASRRAQMFVGDEIVVAYGDRYAPDQFEAEVPDSLEEAHLVAAGGVVGLVTAIREGLDDPTIVQPLGLLCDGQGVLSLSRVAPKAPAAAAGSAATPGTGAAATGRRTGGHLDELGQDHGTCLTVAGPQSVGDAGRRRQGHGYRRRR